MKSGLKLVMASTLLFFVAAVLASCSSGGASTCATHQDCPEGEFCIAEECLRLDQDCPDRRCPVGFVCFENLCTDPDCMGVVCAADQACAGGSCYPVDCASRTCPGLGEICVEDECLPTSCLEVECPPEQRCAAGSCYPINCETKNCPGYGEVCIEGECIERTCVGAECPPQHECAGGYCYPSDCTDSGCPEDQVCVDGMCEWAPCVGVECQDGYQCAEGWCYPEDCPDADCSDDQLCVSGQCTDIACVGVICPDDQVCLDGQCFADPCEGMDCDDQNLCTLDSCQSGACQHAPAEAGQACEDGLFCTVNDACDELGVCVGQERDCSAVSNQCNQGICHEEANACVGQPINEGEHCSDGHFCTEGERCQAGVCSGGNLTDCNDSDGCTLDNCDEVLDFCDHQLTPQPGTEGLGISGSCEDGVDNDCDRLTDGDDPDCQPCQQDADCDDLNPCTINTCSPEHECVLVLADNGTACDDGRYCSSPDSCTDGVCDGPVRDCSHLDDQCLYGACNESSDQCEALPLSQGLPCDDGEYCNGTDSCDAAGACQQHSGDPCAGGAECNRSCNETAESCFDSSGTACGSSSDTSCDNPDSCNGAGVCLPNPEPAGTGCVDGEYCNGTDSCDGSGACSVHTGDPCLSGGQCNNDCNEQADNCYVTAGTACGSSSTSQCDQADTCDGQGACDDNPVSAGTPCNDGQICTENDACDGAGSCLADVLPAESFCLGAQLVTCDGSGGVADLVDCPLGCNSAAAPDRCYMINPSNVDDEGRVAGGLDPLLCSGNTAFDPIGLIGPTEMCLDTDALSVTECATDNPIVGLQPPAVVLISQTLGPELAVIAYTDISIPFGYTLRARGGRGLVLLACNDADIQGVLVAQGQDVQLPGAGGGLGGDPDNPGESYGQGGGGTAGGYACHDPVNNGCWVYGIEATGGGGGAFGGTGAAACTGVHGLAGGSGGQSFGGGALVPLLGGGGGGSGVYAWSVFGFGGGGGGALQLTAGNQISISQSAAVGSPGMGGGQGYTTIYRGPGGGGAGGGVLLEAVSIVVDGAVVANGGGGGSMAEAGSNGTLDGSQALGGEQWTIVMYICPSSCYPVDREASAGGLGGAGTTPNGGTSLTGWFTGGGGGGAGRIRLNTLDDQNLQTSGTTVISPSVTTGQFSRGAVDVW